MPNCKIMLARVMPYLRLLFIYFIRTFTRCDLSLTCDECNKFRQLVTIILSVPLSQQALGSKDILSKSKIQRTASRPTNARSEVPRDLAALTALPVNGTVVLVLEPPVAFAVPEGAEADAEVRLAFREDPVPVG